MNHVSVEILPDFSGFAARLARETAHPRSAFEQIGEAAAEVIAAFEALVAMTTPATAASAVLTASEVRSALPPHSVGLRVSRAQIERALSRA